MKVNDVYFAGIGTADTDFAETSHAVERGWYEAEERERSRLVSISVAGTRPAPDLAVEAAQRALEVAGRKPAEFSGVFHTNVHPQGPDGWSAPHYINRLTVNQPVTSLEVRNGCLGFFATLNLATSYLRADRSRVSVLLTAGDNFGTPAVDRWRATTLFVLADGGGSVVLSRKPGFARLLSVHSVSDPELELRDRVGEELFPPSLTIGKALNFDERWARFGQLQMEGTLPPMGDFGGVMIEASKTAMDEADTSLEQIAKVVHDGFTWNGLRDVFLDPIGVEEQHGIWDFTRRHGHAGPVDAIRGLQHVWRTGQVEPGDKVLLVGGAPGMEAACAVVEILQAP
ncbi:ketoacyl-ACP synthase III family protein [Amycolatopsis sp. lyj-90]|uniref:ketoacyl-ACP synthase III family protein n=1 Tax=Amycolatopsis sp. lyj-90 TaxID=2789285 RepID=UPI00397D13A5